MTTDEFTTKVIEEVKEIVDTKGSLVCTKKGEVVNCFTNIGILLAAHFPGLHYCQFSYRFYGEKGLIEDSDLREYRTFVESQFGFAVGKDNLYEAFAHVAFQTHSHPVREYLAALPPWDGVPRLERWIIDGLGADDNEYVRAVSSKYLISAVARVLCPGCQVDTCLILEGIEGLGKSSVFRHLFSPWFTDEIADFGTKDSEQQLHGAWCVELSELTALSRAEVSRTKAFISKRSDRFRLPYARLVSNYDRQNVFGGSVNDAEYLESDTGNRRFWPVKVRHLLDYEKVPKDLLWAEAMERYLSGEPWHLSQALMELQKEEAETRTIRDAWADLIARWIDQQSGKGFIYPDGKEGWTLPQILSGALRLESHQWSRSNQIRAGRCMSLLGFVKRRYRVESALIYAYVRELQRD